MHLSFDDFLPSLTPSKVHSLAMSAFGCRSLVGLHRMAVRRLGEVAGAAGQPAKKRKARSQVTKAFITH